MARSPGGRWERGVGLSQSPNGCPRLCPGRAPLRAPLGQECLGSVSPGARSAARPRRSRAVVPNRGARGWTAAECELPHCWRETNYQSPPLGPGNLPALGIRAVVAASVAAPPASGAFACWHGTRGIAGQARFGTPSTRCHLGFLCRLCWQPQKGLAD